MSSNENRYGFHQLVGNVDVPYVTFPTIRGTKRRSDPDGISATPYFSGLNTKTLDLELTPAAGGAAITVNITFTSDDYQTAIDTIKAASSLNLDAKDDNGFLRLLSKGNGGKHYLKVLSGTAVDILGFLIDPVPGSASYAGEIDTSSAGGKRQSNPHGTAVVAADEDFTSKVFNRAVVGAALHSGRMLRELEREFVTSTEVSISPTTNTPGDHVFVIDDPNLRIPLKAFSGTSQSNPSVEALSHLVSFLDAEKSHVYESPDAVANYAQGRLSKKIQVTGVFYADLTQTLDDTASFAVWGTPDGKSIFGSTSLWQKDKVPSTGITSITGNVIKATGALFVTKKAQPGDTVVISGATNTVPFDHNGEFVIEEVFNEDTISVRPKSIYEDLVFPTNTRPTKLSADTGGGMAALGSVKVPVGFYLPASSLVFRLDFEPPAGTYFAKLAVSKFLRKTDVAGLIRTIDGNFDEFYEAFYSHVTSTANRHPATAIDYAGGAAWFDGATNPAATVEAQLDKFLTDLISTADSVSGANKIGSAAVNVLFGSLTRGLAASSINNQISTFLGYFNDHLKALTISGVQNRHRAQDIDYAGSPTTKGGWFLPSGITVEDALDRALGSGLLEGLSHNTVGVGWLNFINTWIATQIFNGSSSASDTTAAIETTSVPTNRKLLWRIALGTRTTPSGTASVWARLYSKSGDPQALEFTINCSWNGSAWVRDANADSFRWSLESEGLGSNSGTSLFRLKASVRYRVNNTPPSWSDGEGTSTAWHEEDVIWTGPAPFRTGSGASSDDDMYRAMVEPRSRSSRANSSIAERTLIHEFRGPNHKLRLYHSSEDIESLELSVNCFYGFTLFGFADIWQYDEPARKAMLIQINRNTIKVYVRPDQANTTDNLTFWSHDDTGWDGNDGEGGFPVLGVNYDIQNPDAGVGFKNRLTAKNIPKAWARIECDGPTSNNVEFLQENGFNIGSVTKSGTSGVNVSLPSGGQVDGTKYCASVTINTVGSRGKDTTGADIACFVAEASLLSAGLIQIIFRNSANGEPARLWDGSGSDRSNIHFTVLVFGAQES